MESDQSMPYRQAEISISRIPLLKGVVKGFLACLLMAAAIWGIHWLVTNQHLGITLGLYLIAALAALIGITLAGMWVMASAKIAQLRGWITLGKCWWVTLALLVLLPTWQIGFHRQIHEYLTKYLAGGKPDTWLAGVISWTAVLLLAWLLLAGLLKGGLGRSLVATLIAVAIPAAACFAVLQFGQGFLQAQADRVKDHLRMSNMRETAGRLLEYAKGPQGMPASLDEVPPNFGRNPRPPAYALFPRATDRAGYVYVKQWSGLHPSDLEIPESLVMVYEDPAENGTEVYVAYADGEVRRRSADQARQEAQRTRHVLSQRGPIGSTRSSTRSDPGRPAPGR